MDFSIKQWGAVGAALLMGAGGGGGGMNWWAADQHEATLEHERAVQEMRTAAIQKLLEDTRQECRDSREALSVTFSASYSTLQQMCLARCQ